MKKTLTINESQDDSHHLLEVQGELDFGSSPRLLEAMRQALKSSALLKVDLSQVSYVDSSGIAVLIQGYKLARKKTIDFVLVNPSPRVMAVIELSQLGEFFTFESSAGEA